MTFFIVTAVKTADLNKGSYSRGRTREVHILPAKYYLWSMALNVWKVMYKNDNWQCKMQYPNVKIPA
jgi:hypothetical protein